MKSMLQINSPGRAHAWLLGFALVRSVLDYFWVPAYRNLEVWLLSWFNTTVYLYALYLLIPAMAGFLSGKVFSRPVDNRAVLRESVLVWIVYPAVTIISLITKSPPTRSIEWYRYIPTFMVDRNFFPIGMMVVIPVLAIFYSWLLVRYSDADWLRALASVLISLLVIYLVYYQYTLRLFFYVYWLYGPLFAFGYYNLCFLVPLYPIAKRFHSAFGGQRVTLPWLVLAFTLISIGLMGMGLLAGPVST